jgi:glycerate dehydrogenase
MQHTIVFLDRDTVGVQLRQPNFPHSYQEYAVTPADCVVDRLKDATIAILNKVPMRANARATAETQINRRCGYWHRYC